MTISEPDRDVIQRVQNLTGPVEGEPNTGLFTSTSDLPAHRKRGDPFGETRGYFSQR